jgi:spore germination protein KB
MLVVGFVLGSSLLLMPDGTHDAWFSLLLSLLLGGAIAAVYLALARRFPGQTLDEIAEAVYGPALGRAVAAAFLWYLFHLGSMVLGNFAFFFKTAFQPETPLIVFSLPLALVAASAARNGVEVIARSAQVLVPLAAVTIFANSVLLLKDFDGRWFLPLLETPWRQLWAMTIVTTAFPFGETVALLMVLPFLNRPAEGAWSVAKGLAGGWALLFILVVRTIGVLGPSAGIYAYPNYEAVRLINFGRFFTRLEVVVAVNMVTMDFLKVSVLLYGTALGTAQVLRLRSYLPLVFPLAVLMALLSLINFPNTAANAEFTVRVYPWYALPFQVGLPLLLLLVAALRGVRGKGRPAPMGKEASR